MACAQAVTTSIQMFDAIVFMESNYPSSGREDRSEREVAELQRQAAEAEARHEVMSRRHSATSLQSCECILLGTLPLETLLLTPTTSVMQELAARLPEATAPLLRQLDAGRAAAAAQSAAWAAAEAALSQRAADAEARAAAASEAVRTSAERLQVNPAHVQDPAVRRTSEVVPGLRWSSWLSQSTVIIKQSFTAGCTVPLGVCGGGARGCQGTGGRVRC